MRARTRTRGGLVLGDYMENRENLGKFPVSRAYVDVNNMTSRVERYSAPEVARLGWARARGNRGICQGLTLLVGYG